MERDIKQSVNELGSLLSKVKGSGHMSLNQPSQKTDTAQHAVMIVTPLMDFIDKLFSQLAQVRRRRRRRPFASLHSQTPSPHFDEV